MCIIIGGMGEDKRIDMVDWRIITYEHRRIGY